VTLVANPVFIRVALVSLMAASMFMLGLWAMRRMRKEVVSDVVATGPRAENVAAFTVATFNGVIQQLKDKEQELRRMRQQASERASVSENIAAAILTNLDTGVVVFNSAGLGQFANPAAREILGYSTLSGMHPRDLFRGVRVSPEIAVEAVQRALHHASVSRGLRIEYATPKGVQRSLMVTVAPALGENGQCYGAVCLLKRLDEAS
jgi:PAS domain-containing protein